MIGPRQLRIILCAAVLLSSTVTTADERAFYRKTHDGYRLPDPEATPGVIAHRDVETICNTQWGKDARHVTPKMKADSYAKYHAKKVDKKCCEVDHLISRDVGGGDDPKNLWPQPWTEARSRIASARSGSCSTRPQQNPGKRARAASDLDGVFAGLLSQPPRAVLAYPLRLTSSDWQRTIDFGTKHRLPMMTFTRSVVQAGALMYFFASVDEMYHRTASYVDKILRGAGVLPVSTAQRGDVRCRGRPHGRPSTEGRWTARL